MIHNLAIKHGAVWVKVCLFEAVDENARRREVYADLGVDDTVRGERNEDVAGIRWVTTRMYPNASEEVASRVCEPENEKDCRCCQRNIEAIFDGRENGHDNCGKPDDELEW
jgi:hypothetical protein